MLVFLFLYAVIVVLGANMLPGLAQRAKVAASFWIVVGLVIWVISRFTGATP